MQKQWVEKKKRRKKNFGQKQIEETRKKKLRIVPIEIFIFSSGIIYYPNSGEFIYGIILFSGEKGAPGAAEQELFLAL